MSDELDVTSVDESSTSEELREKLGSVETVPTVRDGEPQTYWEERSAIAEGAVEQILRILAALAPEARDAIMEVAEVWGKLRAQTHQKFYPKSEVVENGGDV